MTHAWISALDFRREFVEECWAGPIAEKLLSGGDGLVSAVPS